MASVRYLNQRAALNPRHRPRQPGIQEPPDARRRTPATARAIKCSPTKLLQTAEAWGQSIVTSQPTCSAVELAGTPIIKTRR